MNSGVEPLSGRWSGALTKHLLAVAVIALLVALCLTFDVGPLWQAAIAAAHQRPVYAIVAVIFLMIAHNFIPVPAQAIAFTAGSLLGPIVGLMAVWIGAVLAALLAFWMARALGQVFVTQRLSPRQRDRLGSVTKSENWQPWLVVRCLPFVPFNLVNYAAGLTPLPARTFVWTTALGVLPVISLATYAGARMV